MKKIEPHLKSGDIEIQIWNLEVECKTNDFLSLYVLKKMCFFTFIKKSPIFMFKKNCF